METLEAAVLLAASHHATLVPLSLVPVPQARGKGARLEHIQQSKDFLEATQQKASQHHVSIERFEAFTGDVMQSISLLLPQLACDGMILVQRGRNGSLMSAKMIEQLRALSPCPLYIIYLPSKEPSQVSRLLKRFFNRWPAQGQHEERPAQQPASPGEQATPEMVLSRYTSSPDIE